MRVRSALRLTIHIVSCLLLTLLTQVGGLAYILAVLVHRYVKSSGSRKALLGIATFAVGYAGLWVGSGLLAPHFGRVPLPCSTIATDRITLQSNLYCVLNRHYVTPGLKRTADQLAAAVADLHPGTQTLALDANFPFIDGFPLLPHLSHDDGRKLDIAFFYEDETGQPVNATPSPIGYWAFENPRPGDREPCDGRRDLLTMRWDVSWFQLFHKPYRLDEDRTRTALRWLADTGPRYGVTKVFIEPHLKDRLEIAGKVIRFQGCRAARHDDHIHFQVAEDHAGQKH